MRVLALVSALLPSACSKGEDAVVVGDFCLDMSTLESVWDLPRHNGYPIGGFHSRPEARAYFEQAVREATYAAEMQQRALTRLLADPRWEAADQRDALAKAVDHTLKSIAANSVRVIEARANLNYLSMSI